MEEQMRKAIFGLLILVASIVIFNIGCSSPSASDDSSFRKATVEDYTKWLEKFLENGGVPSNYYDYPFSGSGLSWFVAKEDVVIPPYFGSGAVNIIIPEGMRYYPAPSYESETFKARGYLGHSNLYFMEDSRNEGGWIPFFNDMVLPPHLQNKIDVPSWVKLKEEQQRQDWLREKETKWRNALHRSLAYKTSKTLKR